MTWWRVTMALPALVAIGGCESFDGQARPVLAMTAVKDVADAYPPQTALSTFYGYRANPARARAYRDEVIGAYLAAADLRFIAFRQDLSRQSKGTNVGFDLAILALTGTASLTGKAVANGLSAGAAGLTGSRAAIAKELWFDKTLPALLIAMEARRTTVRATIVKRMRDEGPESYSMTEAFADLMAYQAAASLDAAIDTVTAAAGEKATDADKLYERTVMYYSGAPEAGVAELRAEIQKKLDPIKEDKAKLLQAASAAKITVDTDAPAGDIFITMMMAVNDDKASKKQMQAMLDSIATALETKK